MHGWFDMIIYCLILIWIQCDPLSLVATKHTKGFQFENYGFDKDIVKHNLLF
jgi:hypothetical protein